MVAALELTFYTALTLELVELGSMIIKQSEAETAHRMKDLCNKNQYMTQVISGLKISDCGNGLCRGLKVICQEVNSLIIDVPSL